MSATNIPLRIGEAHLPGAAATSLDAVLGASPREVRDCLEAARGGAELSFEQGLLLATAEGAALDALVAVADALRRVTAGDTGNYVVNWKYQFPNVCFVGSRFSGF